MVIARSDCSRAQAALATIGLHHDPDAEPHLPGAPARVRLHTRVVVLNFHPIPFDEHGNGWQELPEGGMVLLPGHGV